MKNYDLVLGDSLKGKDISITEKKVAFLVPNMFNKVASGYDKNCATLVEAKAKETETQNQEVIAPAPVSAPNVPVAPVPPAPVSAPEIKPAEAPVLPPKPELAPPAEEKAKEAPKVEVKPEAPAQPTAPEVKPAEAPVKEKRYAEKVAPMDVIFLRTNKLHANSAPKKLLISVVFKGKLVNHRNKSIAKAAELESASKEEKVESAPKAPEVDPVKEAIKKYLQLLETRKEAIQTKQAAEKEMTELVNKYGITLDMVNAEINKSNNSEG